MPIRTYRCQDCSHQFDLLFVRGEPTSLDHEDINDTSCPECGAGRRVSILAGAHGIELGDVAGVGRHYPRFDAGLGRMVNSAAHRRQLCAAMGVQPVDGDIDLERPHGEMVARREARHARQAAVQDRYDNHPDYQEYRELKDRGYIDDLLEERKEHARNQL